MKVILKRPDGTKKDEVEMDLNADELIESLKKKIQDKHGLDCYKLIYNGGNMADDRTLRSYKVQEGGTVIVQAQYYGQYLPMGVTPAMEKRKAEEAQLNAPPELAPEAKRQATVLAAENITQAEVPWCRVRCATHGDKGMRRQMEDEHLICPSLREQSPALPKERDFAVFALFDGHGGKQVANFVKTFLAAELGNALAADEPREGPLSDKRLKKAVEATFHRLDSRIATELAGCYDGSTANIVLVNEEQAICINLGDTMSYLCRREESEELKAIGLQMRQHKCWMMKEKERILRSGGVVENGRINSLLEVSRAFGDITLKKFGVLCSPEYMKFRIDLEKDRFILLAVDSFWNAWTAAEAIEYAHGLVENEEGRAKLEGDKINLNEVCEELVKHVVEEKKAQDNVSVLLLHFMKE